MIFLTWTMDIVSCAAKCHIVFFRLKEIKRTSARYDHGVIAV